MTKAVQFDYSKALSFLSGSMRLIIWRIRSVLAHEQLHNRTGAGSDYLGWIDLPTNYDKEEFARIQSCR